MKYLDAGLDVLDRQIVDSENEPVGKVDDLELVEAEGGELEVVALLLGPEAYGRRLGGTLGRWISHTGRRFAMTPEPIRIPMDLVEELGVHVKLKVKLEDLDRPDRLDRWLSDNFIGRIPGAHDATK